MLVVAGNYPSIGYMFRAITLLGQSWWVSLSNSKKYVRSVLQPREYEATSMNDYNNIINNRYI